MKFTAIAAAEYERLFYSAQIKSTFRDAVDSTAATIARHKVRYRNIEVQTRVPWHLIGCIHLMECGLDFTKHLHNGDALKARTVNVPAGRPPVGSPPFTWEVSAIDALHYEQLTEVGEWSIARVLYELEAYNGFGYRKYKINTPYLWSGTQHYTKGKFIADRKFDPNAVSKQVGIACILRRMAEVNALDVREYAPSGATVDGSVLYGDTGSKVLALQRRLNATTGILLREDGVAGKRTSDAYKRVYGIYLQGDPRRG